MLQGEGSLAGFAARAGVSKGNLVRGDKCDGYRLPPWSSYYPIRRGKQAQAVTKERVPP
jgi:hypothetical protein